MTPVANRDSWFSSILSSTFTLVSRLFTPFEGRISSRSWAVGGGRLAGAVCAFAFLLVLPPRCPLPPVSFFFLAKGRVMRAASGASSSSSSSSSASLSEE